MLGVACIFVSCVLFIHLGLGDTISEILHVDFILLRCVKCLTFWCVLGYSIVRLPVEQSVCVAFVCSYVSLWAELLLGIIANRYEKYSENVDAEESEADSGIRSETDKDSEEQESFLPQL